MDIDKVAENRRDTGHCSCMDIGGTFFICPTCVNKKKKEREKLSRKFLELKENNNLESKAISLLRLQMLKESWQSLSPADMEALETEAATQNKKPITIHEEQFAATFDMNGKWANLDLEMKVYWMETAELVLSVKEKGTSSNQISVEDRYTHWKSQIHTHYDWLTNHDLVWPSESCRWGALLEAQTNNNCYRLYFSENTDSIDKKNTLVVATAEVVKPGVTGAEQFKVEALSPFVKTQKTILPGQAVRKIRELPSDSNFVATLADTHYICIWNIARQRDRNPMLRSSKSSPDMILSDEYMDTKYALAMFSSDPFILSGGRDKNVRLWNLNDHLQTKGRIKSRGPYEGHKGAVRDVKFYPSSEQEFCSVGEDRCLILWDARVGYDPTVKIEEAHDGFIRSVDWNTNDTNFILTSSSDHTVRMFDRRMLNSGASGSSVYRFEGHNAPVACVQVGKISGSADPAVPAATPLGLIRCHAGHRHSVLDFHWNPHDPWTVVSVSNNTTRTSTGGTLQIWRVKDNLTL